MTIKEWKCNKKKYLDLLLLADEQESMVDHYLERGDMFVMEGPDKNVICTAVVTKESEEICELKNLAVTPHHQRQGYSRKMIEFLCNHYKNKYHTLLVGTRDTPSTVLFYTSCGFRYSHTVPDFFTLYYDHPIIEDNRLLTDMVYFRIELM